MIKVSFLLLLLALLIQSCSDRKSGYDLNLERLSLVNDSLFFISKHLAIDTYFIYSYVSEETSQTESIRSKAYYFKHENNDYNISDQSKINSILFYNHLSHLLTTNQEKNNLVDKEPSNKTRLTLLKKLLPNLPKLGSLLQGHWPSINGKPYKCEIFIIPPNGKNKEFETSKNSTYLYSPLYGVRIEFESKSEYKRYLLGTDSSFSS